MHYIFLHAAREWSGTARAFAAAAHGLAERGHTVTVAAEPDSTVERVMSQDAVVGGRSLFRVEPLSLTGTWFGAARRLRALIKHRGADVVFVHTDREHLVAAVAYRFGSRARIVRRVPVGNTLSMKRSGRVGTWLAPTSFMFTTEQDLRAAILPRAAAGRIVTPLGVREPPAERETVEHLEMRGEYILCVHDASSRSRAATAIRTVAMLVPRHPDLHLIVTGEGGYDDDLRMQAAALGILGRVTFLGDSAAEFQIMRDARLGWVAADSDTAAYGILDLMAAGVPVLAGEGSVAEHYVLSQITGMLLPPDDAYLTAASVAGLLSSDAQRDMMGQASRTRALREFSESAMIDGFEKAAQPSGRSRR